MDRKTTIVLLSYNNLELVRKHLPVILETTKHRNDVSYVVVDNGGNDDLEGFMSEIYPGLGFVRIEENHGFTNGYVQSLAEITSDNYVLISSDIEVENGWFDQAVDLLNSADDIAAVQPKIKSYDKRDEFEYAGAAGGYLDIFGYPFCRGRLINHVEADTGQYDNIEEIFWASGACLFIRADVYHELGGLDNDFFAHMEEIDLCWRIKSRGYRILFQPESTVYHMGGYVIKYGSPQKIFRNHRNNLIMLIKNLPASELIWKLPIRVILDYAAVLSMLAEGNARGAVVVFKAHWQIISRWSKWWSKRRKVQKLHRIRHPQGLYPGSLIWEFFVNGVRTFDKLRYKEF